MTFHSLSAFPHLENYTIYIWINILELYKDSNTSYAVGGATNSGCVLAAVRLF